MTRDNFSMYELEYPSPELSSSAEHGNESETSPGLTMVVALEGYLDAGRAVESVSRHLLSALDHRLIASFNNDELIDYRSRRPPVVIDTQRVMEIDDLKLTLNVVRDNTGRSFLLLSGPEPDMRWQAFSKAVADLADRFDVDQTIALYAAPMSVPHTRPLMVSAHGNDPRLVQPHYAIDSQTIVPGAAALNIERLLNKRGRSVAGYTACVPHYVSASEYPEAALSLLQAIGDVGELVLPLKSLQADAERVKRDLAEQTLDSQEIQQVVASLEEQFDEQLARFRENNPQALIPRNVDVPSSEELGAEFEEFLASIDTDRRSEGGSEDGSEHDIAAHGNDEQDETAREETAQNEEGASPTEPGTRTRWQSMIERFVGDERNLYRIERNNGEHSGEGENTTEDTTDASGDTDGASQDSDDSDEGGSY
ncbi:PAC2 family protein [Corynebacterium ciconiae DSM 44920]|nr:PAC2 family protein [Corynebacterium ciconiae]WKD61381.1 PAC2 family protein [Corynebacterium ciconiae DSM 44920]